MSGRPYAALSADAWRKTLDHYAVHGTHNEQRMASMLRQLVDVEVWMVSAVFDAAASQIMEMVP